MSQAALRSSGPGTSPDDWLDPEETSTLARISVQTLANYRYRGIGPAYSKLTPGRSGRIRYRRQDVVNWLMGTSRACGEGQ